MLDGTSFNFDGGGGNAKDQRSWVLTATQDIHAVGVNKMARF
jgi:hypothetical protein